MGDTLSPSLTSDSTRKEVWVIVAAKLNDEKFSLAELQPHSQLSLDSLSLTQPTVSVVHLIDEMINI